MLKFPKSYLRIYGLKKFFIIILTPTFYFCFYLYCVRIKAKKKDVTSIYLLYLSIINELKSSTAQIRISNIAQVSSVFYLYTKILNIPFSTYTNIWLELVETIFYLSLDGSSWYML